MRVHKFRAWDKQNNEMVNVEALAENIVKIENSEWENLEDFEIMEFSSLSDNDGKEIYEGDIIMQNNNPRDLSRVCFGEFGVRDIETEEVVDKAVGWYTKVLKTDAMSELAPFCYDMQLNEFWVKEMKAVVITNIYERPDLEDAMNADSLS